MGLSSLRLPLIILAILDNSAGFGNFNSDYQVPVPSGGMQLRVRPNIMGKYVRAPGTEFLGRMYAFYSARQSETPIDRLLRMLPGVFPEISILQQISVSPESYLIFLAAFSGGSKNKIARQNWGHI